MIYLFTMVVQALGLASGLVVMRFFIEAIFIPVRRLSLSFQVAHEYLLLLFKECEDDTTGDTNLANVSSRGKQDTMLAQARVNAAAFFRARAGNAQPGSGTKWNGKSDSNASTYCYFYNFNKEHPPGALMVDGTCKHQHKCNQWVSDKGPRGVCGGNHTKLACTYDSSKKRDKPL